MNWLDKLLYRFRRYHEPMIWTSKGNVPEAWLSLEVKWEQTPEYVKCVRIHRDLSGEIVKQGADILSFRGVTGESVIGKIG